MNTLTLYSHVDLGVFEYLRITFEMGPSEGYFCILTQVVKLTKSCMR